jgi:hypothetical protein
MKTTWKNAPYAVTLATRETNVQVAPKENTWMEPAARVVQATPRNVDLEELSLRAISRE